MFQIDRVSLTSTDSYRCDSYCLARVFQNLPAPPKHFGIFDVFCFAKFFSNRKTWGRTWQCLLMTDFYRKVNKFFQKFAKCDPCLNEHYRLADLAQTQVCPELKKTTTKTTKISLHNNNGALPGKIFFCEVCRRWACSIIIVQEPCGPYPKQAR